MAEVREPNSIIVFFFFFNSYKIIPSLKTS